MREKGVNCLQYTSSRPIEIFTKQEITMAEDIFW